MQCYGLKSAERSFNSSHCQPPPHSQINSVRHAGEIGDLQVPLHSVNVVTSVVCGDGKNWVITDVVLSEDVIYDLGNILGSVAFLKFGCFENDIFHFPVLIYKMCCDCHIWVRGHWCPFICGKGDWLSTYHFTDVFVSGIIKLHNSVGNGPTRGNRVPGLNLVDELLKLVPLQDVNWSYIFADKFSQLLRYHFLPSSWQTTRCRGRQKRCYSCLF